MRNASTYRGARRNAIRPLWYWIDGKRYLSKARESWVPNQTPIKERYVIYTGKMYPNGWRSAAERRERRGMYAKAS